MFFSVTFLKLSTLSDIIGSRQAKINEFSRGFSFNNSFIHCFVFHDFKSRRQWGSAVQRPSCLHLRFSKSISDLLVSSPLSPMSPLQYCGKKPSPNTSSINIPHFCISRREWLLWRWWGHSSVTGCMPLLWSGSVWIPTIYFLKKVLGFIENAGNLRGGKWRQQVHWPVVLANQ